MGGIYIECDCGSCWLDGFIVLLEDISGEVCQENSVGMGEGNRVVWMLPVHWG